MSICDDHGEKVEPSPDKLTLEVQDALGALDVPGIRQFAITLLRGCGVPWARVAEAMRCSEATARREGRMPTEGPCD